MERSVAAGFRSPAGGSEERGLLANCGGRGEALGVFQLGVPGAVPRPREQRRCHGRFPGRAGRERAAIEGKKPLLQPIKLLQRSAAGS